MSRRAASVLAAAVALAVVISRDAAAEAEGALEFHRVHVPAGRLGDVPLGGERYVPMPLADFEAAAARARAVADAAGPMPAASAARWRASLDESGRLVGTISCDVGAATAGPGRMLPLGSLRVSRGVLAAEPPREATIGGLGSGLGVAVPQAGTYELEFACPPAAADEAEFRLPLVPALATTLALDLAPGLRPVLSGPAARRAVVVPPAAGTADPWRIDVGPAAELTITIEPRDRPQPAVAIWADVLLAGPRAAFSATIVPAAPWRAGRMVLDQDPALRVTDIRADGDDEPLDHEAAADGRAVAVVVPRWLDGRRTPLVVRGVAPATGPVWRLPLLRATGAAWAGGGSAVRVDPAFVVLDLDLEDCRVMPADTVASWPSVAAEPAADDVSARPSAAFHVEQQGPEARLGVELGPRSASFDVARVTTVEITPGAVLGRAACDVRVTGGEAFEITGRVAPGWIIDAVDAVDRDTVDVAAAAATGRALDWRVVPSPVGDALRIALPFGAAGPRGIGLRIAGHRAGLAPGAAFTTADIDMVRFDGEAADAAVIDLRTDADAFVEIAGRPAGWFEVTGRLAALVEEGKARGRIRGGDRAGDAEARVVRRRPPLDVRVDVALEPRDDVLVQTFTFDCRAAAGVESLLIDFAAPGGDGLAWRVESPAGIAVTARPLDPTEGGLASRSDAIAASWLVELNPAATGPVRIRATRSVPFTAPLPVPLAWVEGATEPGGTVAIAAPAGARPRLVNRWLRDLPTAAAAAAPAVEFAYDGPQPGVAAELAPVVAGADARAWAWRETVTCWCDESGAVEGESRFDVENDGRAALALSLAPGRRLEAVLVGGVALPDLQFGPAGGTWTVPLPPGERRVEVLVRTLASGRPGRGAWRIDPAGCGLDVPVLDRDVRVLVPPALAIASPDMARLPWTERLFGVGGDATSRDEPVANGYRSEKVAPLRERSAGVLVVNRRLITGAAILAAAAAGIVACLSLRRRPAGAVFLVVAAAVAALWVAPAFVPVARAGWWGGLVGLAWSLGAAAICRWSWWWWPVRAAATAAALIVLATPVAGAPADDVRVFVTSGADGETALVPEPLFRALAAFAAHESAAIRVLACRIDVVTVVGRPEWRLALDVDADAGGTIVLDAGPAAEWLPPRAAATGVSVRAMAREARLTAAAPGRHSVELALVPAIERRGPVEIASARIPVAPVAALRLADGDPTVGALECERSIDGAAFTRAALLTGGVGGAAFDVSVSDRVRLVRPVDPRDRLAAAVRAAATVNELSWDGGGCGVEASFDVDAAPDLLRSVVVRVDPRLEGLAVAAGSAVAPRLEPLGAGRVRVDLPEATRERVRVVLTARMPLVDPVGVFDPPGIWLEGVPGEQRTVRLAAAAEFDAALDPPPPAGAPAAELVGRPSPRLIVRRRRPQLRGTQSLTVTFARSGVGLVLEAQLDATAFALTRIPLDVPVGSAIDGVRLVADDPADPVVRAPVDIEWTRPAADRILVLVQRPQRGRFRLEVEARLARQPAPQGRLPLVRARLGAAVPLLVSWSAETPLALAIDAAGDAATSGTIEVADGGREPDYALAVREPPAGAAPVVTAADAVEEASRMERAEVRAVFDARGRVQGFARFDVVARTPQVRLQLPAGMRLFDVLVDGRAVAAEPRAADAWDIPLGAAAWPRTIVIVFAGDAGTALAAGRSLTLEAPRVAGLPAAEVVWSLRPPVGFAVEVAPPARPLDAAALEAERGESAARIAAACERIAATAAAPEQARLEALAALRREGRGPASEEAWRRAAGWTDGVAGETVVASALPLVIRAVPAADATAPARAAATAVLVVVAGLAWSVAGRSRRSQRRG